MYKCISPGHHHHHYRHRHLLNFETLEDEEDSFLLFLFSGDGQEISSIICLRYKLKKCPSQKSLILKLQELQTFQMYINPTREYTIYEIL